MVVSILLTGCGPFGAWAEDVAEPPLRPLWEIGLFNGAASIPHYRGSDQSDEYFIPVPFMIYRGKVVESDRDGLRGVLYEQGRVKSTLSFFLKPPVTEDNDVRVGMADLEPLFELGPALEVELWKKGPQRLVWHNAFRGVAEVDGPDIQHMGWRFGSRLIWRHRDVLGDGKLRVGFNGGVGWGSSEYHSYFYAVQESEVLPTRPVYTASSGYSGASLSGNFMYRIRPRVSAGCFARWDYIGGTTFDDSPLVLQDSNVTAGLAVIFQLFKSERFEHR